MKFSTLKNKLRQLRTGKQGFTIFFAMLVSTLSLAIGLSIYELTIREIDLSSTATQSQFAIFAADSGIECALYWDYNYNGTDSAFASSTTSTLPGSGVLCGGQDITDQGPAAIDLGRYSGCATDSWCVTRTATAATTTFTVNFPPQAYCATVVVAKSGNPSITRVTSNGYNTCAAGGVRVERSLQATY